MRLFSRQVCQMIVAASSIAYFFSDSYLSVSRLSSTALHGRFDHSEFLKRYHLPRCITRRGGTLSAGPLSDLSNRSALRMRFILKPSPRSADHTGKNLLTSIEANVRLPSVGRIIMRR